MDRTEILLSKDVCDKIKKSTVLVVGVGGVGGFAVEALARLHVGKLILIDNDVVEESNKNRQIIALNSTLGFSKVDVFKNRIKDIYPDIEVKPLPLFFDKSKCTLLDDYKLDFIVDAIDSMESKWELIKYVVDHEIPFISVMGMGNKKDPTLIKVATLDKTDVDPVAKKMRELARKDGYDLKKIKVIFSPEQPISNDSGVISSSIIVPASAGLLCGKVFVDEVSK